MRSSMEAPLPAAPALFAAPVLPPTSGTAPDSVGSGPDAVGSAPGAESAVAVGVAVKGAIAPVPAALFVAPPPAFAPEPASDFAAEPASVFASASPSRSVFASGLGEPVRVSAPGGTGSVAGGAPAMVAAGELFVAAVEAGGES